MKPQSELPFAILSAIERSANAGPQIMRQRVWAALQKFELGAIALSEQIREDIRRERKANKGKQKRTEYNEPPQAIKARFEEVHREVLSAGTKKVPGRSRYELKTPLDVYKTDFSQQELEVILRAVMTGAAAERVRVTASYGEGIGGGKKEFGGVDDRQRLAYNTHMHNLAHLPKPFWPVLQWLINGECTVKRIADTMLPGIADERVQRGVGRAILKAMAICLLDIDTKRRGLERGEQRDRAIIDQIRREKAARREMAR